MVASYLKSRPATLLLMFFLTLSFVAYAQSGSSTSVIGTVVDPSGAVVSNATVDLSNPVSGFSRTAVTDNMGKFSFPNVPFNPYHVSVTGKGFSPYAQDVDVRSTVPVNLSITLKVGASAESVTVEANGADLLENTSTFHSDVDRALFDKLPLESQSSSLSSLVTLSSPGIAGFQWSFSWNGGSRREFIHGGWAAHHRPAEQGLFQSDSSRLYCLDGGHLGCAAGRVRGEDQRGN
jgi:hypothetical protein